MSLHLLRFVQQFTNQAMPLTEKDIQDQIDGTQGVHENIPKILDALSNDEEAPDFLKDIIKETGLAEKIAKDAKDPKVDPVSIDLVKEECSKWIARQFLIIARDEPETIDSAVRGLTHLMAWAEQREIQFYTLRCDNKDCTECHILMPCRVPQEWIDNDGHMGLFNQAHTIDGKTLVVFDMEDILACCTGLAPLFLDQIIGLQEMFRPLRDTRVHEFCGLEIDTRGKRIDDPIVKLSANFRVHQEWANLLRTLHWKNAEGIWVKR